MSKTLILTLSDTVVRRHGADPAVRQIRDPRHGVLLRYHKARDRATYHLRHYQGGRERWLKIGCWPDLPVKTVIERLPELRLDLTGDPGRASIEVSAWTAVGELLAWYRDRAATNAQLSDSRRSNIASAINAQLLPRVADLPLAEVTRERIDTRLIWPMQAELSLAYVKSVYGVMRAAFRQAAQLNRIESNPMADLVFGLFVQAKITPKPGRLKARALPEALAGLAELPRRYRLLPLLMLLHGTRISETRQHRWDWIDWERAELEIPGGHTKNSKAHRIPLTDQALTLLRDHRRIQRRYGQSVWLFPGSEGKALDKDGAHELFKALGGGDWTSHDLRKLARTEWADQGVDYIVGEQLLNHTLKDLDAVYIHTAMQTQKRAALEQYHAWLWQRLGPAVLSLDPVPIAGHTDPAGYPLQ